MITRLFSRYPIIRHVVFWIPPFLLLTYIYGTAFGSLELGLKVIAMLMPVHLLYFYLLDYLVVKHYYIKGAYLRAFLVTMVIILFSSFLYRIVEIFLTDPYIIRFYQKTDPDFSWEKIGMNWMDQLFHPVYFVTALERSNAVVWIGITLRLFNLSHERKQFALQAELDFLKAQLHPHFLFNSLNNIYSLSLDKSEKTPEVVLGISNILRYSLYECTAQEVSLKRDIDILNDYIKLEQLRYDDRLELNVFICRNSNGLRIAPLLMLPLVENAFKHGTGSTVDNPWINIQLHINGNNLTLNISNSKADFAQNSNAAPGKIGVENVRKRLELLYPGKHELIFFDEQDCFITVLNMRLTN